MPLEKLLEIGEAGPLAAVGVGVAAVVVPAFVPSLREPAAQVLKSSIRLFLDAELGADNALTDRLVDTSMDRLMKTVSDHRANRRERGGHALDRFFHRARAASNRRGFSREDADRRFRKHLSKMQNALQSKHRKASPREQEILEHLLRQLGGERSRASQAVDLDRNG